jgi:mannose-1-phosphate guanylyltransferase
MSDNENLSALLLCAGLGTRLRPLTDQWPKCLVPINGRPLLEYWLCALIEAGIHRILINGHHLSATVESFLALEPIRRWVTFVHEPALLGTAATLRHNRDFFASGSCLLIHADNLVGMPLRPFVDFHCRSRPVGTDMTMMTFKTDHPERCGIVELDVRGVVRTFHEKVINPPGNLANGAVYLLDRGVVDWVVNHDGITDFSTGVIPAFVGRIASYHNATTHCDIGTWEALLDAQSSQLRSPSLVNLSEWSAYSEFMTIRSKIETVDRHAHYSGNAS